MKKLSLLIYAAILATAAITFTESSPIPAPSGSAKTQKYTCTMHPEVMRDKPGKCPKCGMKLVAKEDSDKKA